jgi:hypothetical protein
MARNEFNGLRISEAPLMVLRLRRIIAALPETVKNNARAPSEISYQRAKILIDPASVPPRHAAYNRDARKFDGIRTMSKTTKSPASRPPVDALQYEKLALSAFELCVRQMSQLDTLVSMASAIVGHADAASDECRAQRAALEALAERARKYREDLASDSELFRIIALDSKGVAHIRITASHAARLLKDAGEPEPSHSVPIE